MSDQKYRNDQKRNIGKIIKPVKEYHRKIMTLYLVKIFPGYFFIREMRERSGRKFE